MRYLLLLICVNSCSLGVLEKIDQRSAKETAGNATDGQNADSDLSKELIDEIGYEIVANETLMPNCTTENKNKAYFVLELKLFRYCDGTKYIDVAFKGDIGAKGDVGDKGDRGQDLYDNLLEDSPSITRSTSNNATTITYTRNFRETPDGNIVLTCFTDVISKFTSNGTMETTVDRGEADKCLNKQSTHLFCDEDSYYKEGTCTQLCTRIQGASCTKDLCESAGMLWINDVCEEFLYCSEDANTKRKINCQIGSPPDALRMSLRHQYNLSSESRWEPVSPSKSFTVEKEGANYFTLGFMRYNQKWTSEIGGVFVDSFKDAKVFINKKDDLEEGGEFTDSLSVELTITPPCDSN